MYSCSYPCPCCSYLSSCSARPGAGGSGGSDGLPSGSHPIWLCVISRGFNIDSFTLAQGNPLSPLPAPTPPPPRAPSPTDAFGGDPAPIPGAVEAEEFDEGGEAVGYSDTTASNFGGVSGEIGFDSGSGYGTTSDSPTASGLNSGYRAGSGSGSYYN